MMERRAWSLAALAGVAMALGGRPCAAAARLTPLQADSAIQALPSRRATSPAANKPPTLQDTYSAIKALESNFPIPQPKQDVDVGTFDTATGEFFGLATE